MRTKQLHARRSAGAGEIKEINMSELIDRQQAIEAICMETCGVSLKTERCMVHCTEVQTVEKLPSAQPEQPEAKRGEWLERDVIDEPKGKHITQWQSARCSVCGRYHTTPYLYSFTHYNFCPNCGADMREVTE